MLKGHPSQEEHKTIFSSLKTTRWHCLLKVNLQSSFLTVRYSLCNTYIDFPQSANSRKSIFWNLAAKKRPSCGAKAIADWLIDEFPVSHLMETKNAGKSIWFDKTVLQIFKPLKMVFCYSCDGVPLKFKKKNGRASSWPVQIELVLTPLRIRRTIPSTHLHACVS
jgi:hypothetical protein